MTAAPEELAKFERLGAMWRDPEGPMRVLHAPNPLRTCWIADLAQRHHAKSSIDRLEVLDVGRDAGLLSESLARLGASVTGIDPVARNVMLGGPRRRSPATSSTTAPERPTLCATRPPNSMPSAPWR